MDAHVYPRGRDDFDLKMGGENGNISYSLVFLIETRFLIGEEEEDCRELGTCVNHYTPQCSIVSFCLNMLLKRIIRTF